MDIVQHKVPQRGQLKFSSGAADGGHNLNSIIISHANWKAFKWLLMDLPTTTMMAEERRKFNLQQQEVENALQVKDSWVAFVENQSS